MIPLGLFSFSEVNVPIPLIASRQKENLHPLLSSCFGVGGKGFI